MIHLSFFALVLIGNPQFHIVKKGETIYSISKEYNQNIQDLIDKNNLTNQSKLSVGDTIWLPTEAEIAKKLEKYTIHIVQKGETIFWISRNNTQISFEELIKINHINSNFEINIGQRIITGYNKQINLKPNNPNKTEIKKELNAKPLKPIAVLTEKPIVKPIIIDTKDTMQSKAIKPAIVKSPTNVVIKKDTAIVVKPLLIIKTDTVTHKKEIAIQKIDTTNKRPILIQKKDSINQVKQIPLLKLDTLIPKKISSIAKSDSTDIKKIPSIPDEFKNADIKNDSTTTDFQSFFENNNLGKSSKCMAASLASAKDFALFNEATVGSFIRVRNVKNNRAVYLKVIGKLPNLNSEKQVCLKLSQSASDKIMATGKMFLVEIEF